MNSISRVFRSFKRRIGLSRPKKIAWNQSKEDLVMVGQMFSIAIGAIGIYLFIVSAKDLIKPGESTYTTPGSENPEEKKESQ